MKKFKKEELDAKDHEDVEKHAKLGRFAAGALTGVGAAFALLKNADWEKVGEVVSDVQSFVSDITKKG